VPRRPATGRIAKAKRRRRRRTSFGAAPAFSPEDISGLTLWYDAGTIVNLEDTDPMDDAWLDQSGNNNDAELDVATSEPLYRTTDGPNSQPWVEFAVANNTRLLVPDVFNGVVTAATCFAVVRVENLAASAAIHNFGSGDNALYTHSDGKIYEDWGSSARKDNITGGVTLTDWHIYTVRSAASAFDLRHNGGAADFSTGTNTVGWRGATITLGSDGDGSANGGGNGMAEYLVYASALSTTNMDLVGDYLADKYGITWTATS
jgi:hypothetical protein